MAELKFTEDEKTIARKMIRRGKAAVLDLVRAREGSLDETEAIERLIALVEDFREEIGE